MLHLLFLSDVGCDDPLGLFTETRIAIHLNKKWTTLDLDHDDDNNKHVWVKPEKSHPMDKTLASYG